MGVTPFVLVTADRAPELERAQEPPPVSVAGVFHCCGFCFDKLPPHLRCDDCVIDRAELEAAALNPEPETAPGRPWWRRWRRKDNR